MFGSGGLTISCSQEMRTDGTFPSTKQARKTGNRAPEIRWWEPSPQRPHTLGCPLYRPMDHSSGWERPAWTHGSSS